MSGKEAPLLVAMTKMIVKLPERHGWPAGPHPASVIMSQLSKIVPEPAVANITTRKGPSATFLLHRLRRCCLKQSGKGGIFYKETAGVELELLWLEETRDLPSVCKLAVHSSCFGVVEKGGSFESRYAIRFRDAGALRTFAAAHSIPDLSAFGRWKVSGIQAVAGIHRVMSLLRELKWLDVAILYISEGHAVFMSSNRGFDDAAFFRHAGAPGSSCSRLLTHRLEAWPRTDRLPAFKTRLCFARRFAPLQHIVRPSLAFWTPFF